MKIKILLMILVISTSLFSQNRGKYSLDYCIEKSMENSREIKSSKLEVLSYEAEFSAKRTNFFPTFEFTGNYTRLSKIVPFSVTFPTGKEISIFPVILDNYGLNLTVNQPIYTGGRIKANYQMSKNKFFAKKEESKEVKNNIKYLVSQFFWYLVLALESREVIDESIRMVKSHLKDVINLKENGMASENDVKKVEVQLYNMQLIKTTAEKNIEISRSFLCKFMNLPLDTKIEPEYDISEPVFDIKYEQLITTVEKNNHLIKSMNYTLKSFDAAKNLSKSSFYPSVYFIGNYNYARPNRRIMPLVDEWNDTWDAGISVQFIIWNWGKRKMEHESAKNRYKKIKTDYNNLIMQTKLDIKKVYLEIKEALKKYRLSKKMVEQAKENYRISKDKYKNGMLLNSELLGAETDLLKSKLEVTKSIIDFKIKKAELNKLVGLND